MSVKSKTKVEDIPNIWYMKRLMDSDVMSEAAYDIATKRLFIKYTKTGDWFLYENVSAKWWRDFTLADRKDDFVKSSRKEVLTEKSKLLLLI